MSASEESTNGPPTAIARYFETTTLHGLPEVYAAVSKLLRALWVVVILLALFALVSQVATVTELYMEDDFGTKEKAWMPKNIPGTILCPQFRYLEGPDITEDIADYILGYFPLAQHLDNFMLYRKLRPIPVDAKERARKLLSSHGNSKAALVEALMPEKRRYVTKKWSVVVKDVNITTFVSFHGGCYLAAPSGIEMTAQSSDIAAYVLEVNTTLPSLHHTGMHYKLYIGGKDDNGAFAGLKNAVEIRSELTYTVKVRATRRVGYPGRRNDRCRQYTRSDYVHCALKWADENVPKHMAKGCITGADASANFREEIVPRGNQTYCNLFDDLVDGFGFFAIRNDLELQKAMARVCMPPCVETVYDLHAASTPGVGLARSTIVVMMDSPAFSKKVTEYPLVNLGDYLAALGGTFGLYFGASIMSFVQILFACLEAALGNRDRRKSPKPNSEQERNRRNNRFIIEAKT